MKRVCLYISVFTFILTLTSCEENEKISTDLIIVPATASSTGEAEVKLSEISFKG